jgi:hypothetical protein
MNRNDVQTIAKHYGISESELEKRVRNQEKILGRELDYNEIDDIAESMS